MASGPDLIGVPGDRFDRRSAHATVCDAVLRAAASDGAIAT